MADVIAGACNCGKVRLEMKREGWPAESLLCHCLNCRASSGSVATLNLAVPLSALTLRGSPPKTYVENETASGKPMDRKFCGDCGSAVFSVSSALPDTAFVKAGLFVKGGVRLPRPGKGVFCRRRETWETEGGWESVE